MRKSCLSISTTLEKYDEGTNDGGCDLKAMMVIWGKMPFGILFLYLSLCTFSVFNGTRNGLST